MTLKAYALPPAAESHILRVYVLLRTTIFKHGWWFWTVTLKKSSVWQFSPCTFTKASPLSKIPGVRGSDIMELKKKKKNSQGTCFDLAYAFFLLAISLFQSTLWNMLQMQEHFAPFFPGKRVEMKLVTSHTVPVKGNNILSKELFTSCKIRN